MKVVWLVSWYPTPLAPFDGDFIQRHARAVALHCQVEVIHIVKDAYGNITPKKYENITVSGNLTERIIYYKPFKTGIDFLDKYISHRAYRKLYQKAIKLYITDNGKPAFVHVHVALKSGLIALWMKKKYGIPYIVSEHWAWFLPEAIPGMNDFSAIYKKWWQQIFNGAYKITVVSKVLGDALVQRFGSKGYALIPNVVDTTIFYPVAKQNNTVPAFAHISSLSYQKNPEHIIEAFAILKQRAIPFSLYIFGHEKKQLRDMVFTKGLSTDIFFKEEVPQAELVIILQQMDALILYSRFETFGCVLIEANACGVPVIVSDIPVFHEIVEEGVNGVFVENNSPKALAEKLFEFIQQKIIFDKAQIAIDAADKYNNEKIGKQFIELYQQALNDFKD